MKRSVLFLFFICSILFSKAQLTYQWANSVGSSANSEYGQAIASDPSGNVYVAGAFTGVVDFDPSAATANLTSLSGSQDIFLAKYTSTGAFIWVKQIAGTNTEKPYDLVADASGAYLAGNFLGTVDFDPNVGVNNITFLGGGTDGDGFFAKYDVNGNLSWVDRIGSTVNDRVTSIAIDASANVYVTGFIGGNADMDPSASSASLNVSGTYNAYIGKYSSTGAYIFAKQITGGYSEGDDINVDASGNIYLTGSYATTNDFDPSAATANLSTSSLTQLDIFLAKYTSAGLYTFAKQIGGIGVDIGYQVRPDALGNIYLGGVFSSTCDFDPTATVNSLTSAGQGDLFVAKYDVSGNLTWKTGTGGTTNDYCFGLGLDGSNNVYITGKVQGTNIDFDPSASSALLTSASSCMYIASYSSTGNFLSLSSPTISSTGNGLCVNSSLYIAGMFAGTGDFDFSASTANLTSLGSDDVFFAKYNVCAGSPPAQPSIISGNINPCTGTSTTYSVTNDPLASSYTWTFPVGWIGTSTANVSAPTVSNSGIVTVVATNSCGTGPSRTLNVTVSGFSNAIINYTNVSCFNAQNGQAIISYTGSGGPYTILWQPSLATTATVTNLGIGSHSATVTDGNGCSITKTINVTQPTALSVNITTVVPTNCNQSNGSASVSVSGGVGGYTYLWSAGPTYTNALMSNVVAGAYTVTVKDANNCTQPAIAIINDIAGPTIVVTNTVPANCFGSSTGGATVSASGGFGPLTFLWSYLSQTTQNVSNLPAGVHTVTVTDQANCISSATVNITQASSALVTSITSVTNIACSGQFNGAAQITASGGAPGYNYLWSPSAQTNSVLTGIGAGIYTCSVTDANGCVSTKTVSITQPSPLLVTTNTVVNNACFGYANGQIAVSISGGTPTYSISWSPALPATSTVSNLVAGSYTLFVVDIKGCTTNSVYTLIDPPALGIQSLNTTAACPSSNGSATITIAGGTPGYSYSWMPSAQTTSIAAGLPVGNYTVTVIDNKGCSITTSTSINLGPPLNVQVTQSSFSICAGQTFTMNAIGASIYNWSPCTPSVMTMCVGPTVVAMPPTSTQYTVTGGVAIGCPGTAIIAITVIPSPTVTVTSNTSIICVGETATLTASGALSYSWNTTGTAPSITVNPTTNTTYTVTGNGSNGCSASATITQSVSLCTGINSSFAGKNSELRIYPNPFTNEITLIFNDINETANIEMYNSVGQLVFYRDLANAHTVTDLGQLSEGIYFVRVKIYGETKLIKLVKE
ncbi:MAG: T9SS type A sorting domain-containing protein [Bacteroidia bacterium]|nr:T9SS type A sorting domain-containing protein [Bacteroidia bacterium]